MPDILYKATIQAAARKVMLLPNGMYIARDTEIFYHFYNISDDPNALLRAASASQRIRTQTTALAIEPSKAELVVDTLLLGAVKPAQVRSAVRDGSTSELVRLGIEAGDIDPELPAILREEVLPFRASPVTGKNLIEIAKSPAAVAAYVVVATGDKAPMAVIVLPVGVVAMYVAHKAGARLSNWVDRKLKAWLK